MRCEHLNQSKKLWSMVFRNLENGGAAMEAIFRGPEIVLKFFFPKYPQTDADS